MSLLSLSAGSVGGRGTGETLDREQLLYRFSCSLKVDKTSFLGYASLYLDVLSFQSDSQARIITVRRSLLIQRFFYLHTRSSLSLFWT